MQGSVVAVLRGGPSREHEVSLKSGAAMLRALEGRHSPRDIYIDKQGVWHFQGKPTLPERVLPAADVVLIALHGEYGEDGQLQRLLERFGVPYAGSDSLGSFLAMHKLLSKEKLKEAGAKVPQYRFAERASEAEEAARDAVRSFHQPVVVKPVGWGSSVGVQIVAGYAPVLAAIERLFAEGAPSVLIEEHIKGTEATQGIVENMRSDALYALPPIEIIPPAGDFFSYDAKYTGSTREIVPGRFPRKVNEELARLARLAHESLGLRHYSRSDFIVAPSGIYYLETNTLPGMTTESLMPKALAAVGISLPDFLDHLVNLARAR